MVVCCEELVEENKTIINKKEKILQILSFNVHGLSNKILFPKFFDYLNKFDIFALYETHVISENSNEIVDRYGKFFSGFELKWITATKLSRYGRPIGGILLGYKKDLIQQNINISFKNTNEVNYIKIKNNEFIINFLPIYLRLESWYNDFEVVKRFCLENDLSNLILAGDMNVRIGEEQTIPEEFLLENPALAAARCSKDKIINRRGRDFLNFAQDCGLIILNGRTLGDAQGDFTYVSVMGQSVIDLVGISVGVAQKILNMTVDGQIYSDHMPIKLELSLSNVRDSARNLKLLPKLKWWEDRAIEYKIRVEEKLENLISNGGEISTNDLKNIIYECAIVKHVRQSDSPFREKWFDTACHKNRATSFKLLNKWRKSNSIEDKIKYLEENRNYKNLCYKKFKQYYEMLEIKINMVRDSREWWSLVKELKTRKMVTGSKLNAEIYSVYFKELLNPPLNAPPIHYAEPFIKSSLLDRDITISEVQAVLKKAKYNKAPGCDRIPYEFFVNAPTNFLEQLIKNYNKMLDTGSTEESFLKTLIFPIHKKGDPNVVNNYRGISFMDCVIKILMGVLQKRLDSWVEKNQVLNEFQAGFRRGYSTIDNIFSLISLIKIKNSERKKVYAFFVDFRAAFDCVARSSLFYKLSCMGVSTKFLNLLRALYTNTRAAVWDGEDVSEYFETGMGVKQGCLMSPVLFSLMLNDLHDYIGGGLKVGELSIRLLMYADDIIILADDVDVLQKMIEQLSSYCKLWNLSINLEKSKIMVFRKGGKLARNEKWTLDGEEIDIVNSFKYLGMILTPGLTFKTHLLERIEKSKGSLNSVWGNFMGKRYINLSSKYNLFKAVARSIYSYGCQIWGYLNFEETDRLQRYFIKKLFNLPDCTPNYQLHLETGLPEMHLYTLEMHLNYINKVLFKYSIHRLPARLARMTLEKKLFWYKDWENMCTNVGIEFNGVMANEESQLCFNRQLLMGLREKCIVKNQNSAVNSSHGLYNMLNYDVGFQYFNESFTKAKISWLFKARCGLVYLNGSKNREESNRICSMCNLNEIENIEHFVGHCPILKGIRKTYLKAYRLTRIEMIQILNSMTEENLENLYQFLKAAWFYRRGLVEQFNF